MESKDDMLQKAYQEFIENSDSKITADQFNTAYEIVCSQIEKELIINLTKIYDGKSTDNNQQSS